MRPMQSLGARGGGGGTVRCPPAIPNVADGGSDRLALDAVVAVEPFATDGQGEVVERGVAEVFRLDPRRSTGSAGSPEVVAAIRRFHGLPLARRPLADLPRPPVG